MLNAEHPRRARVAALALGLWLACDPSFAAPPAPLVIEQIAEQVWRGDARGLTVEIRQEPDGRLVVAFLGAGGEAVAPPPADEVTLTTAAGVQTRFELGGATWRSQSAARPPADGARLSIVEADHRHDFELNVHAPDPKSPSGAAKP